MCIALLTTAHPSYAIIILNNRDEFIRRPTSRPHWWSSPAAPDVQILSARDLARPEQGTWLGVTKAGKVAVLTNYREQTSNGAQPIEGVRSRGALVTAWLTSSKEESTAHFVDNLLKGEGVAGVGGFSLVCGRLRRRNGGDQGENVKADPKEIEPMAIISNRSARPDDVPWIAGERDQVYGLSNTYYSDPNHWPKVDMGKDLLNQAVEQSVVEGWSEEEFVNKLYEVLDHDTLPKPNGEVWDMFAKELKKSIFIPPIREEDLASKTPGPPESAGETTKPLAETQGANPAPHWYLTGTYGTQRQTIIMVDWDGNVTYRERALWDDNGEPVEKGQADLKFEFKAEEWND